MVDKSKLVKIYTDTVLDMGLLDRLSKARELAAMEHGGDSLLTQFQANHAQKILILQKDKSTSGTRLTITPVLGRKQSSIEKL